MILFYSHEQQQKVKHRFERINFCYLMILGTYVYATIAAIYIDSSDK